MTSPSFGAKAPVLTGNPEGGGVGNRSVLEKNVAQKSGPGTIFTSDPFKAPHTTAHKTPRSSARTCGSREKSPLAFQKAGCFAATGVGNEPLDPKIRDCQRLKNTASFSKVVQSSDCSLIEARKKQLLRAWPRHPKSFRRRGPPPVSQHGRRGQSFLGMSKGHPRSGCFPRGVTLFSPT